MKKTYLIFIGFLFSACSDNAQQVQNRVETEQKDYLEKYYEQEDKRYENYLQAMAG